MPQGGEATSRPSFWRVADTAIRQAPGDAYMSGDGRGTPAFFLQDE